MKKFNALEEEISVMSILFRYIGAAYLVRNKKENKEYIAKKIMLGALSEKE